MDNPENPNDIADELRALGENLARTLRTAWESPERMRLQEDIEQGLAELTASLKSEADSFQQSPTGQQLKSDIDDLRQRVHSGEVADKAREDLLKVLKMVNTELEKAVSRWRGEDRA